MKRIQQRLLSEERGVGLQHDLFTHRLLVTLAQQEYGRAANAKSSV